ncbi:ATP-binding protein [Neolewinella agarilytica]|uniref:Serine/threonine-protein kinase RsbW n=1 Tax=Neolewinella agarilytica TaxID=478744 RepID=A0A1H9EXS0_9BACT|nr:ATP-binding protein [Neolewinella agarilytica]SEQ30462.1 serine/threonine-protein kinase RsbW [Neolewinella agarilytica]
MLKLASDPSNITKVEKYVSQIADRYKLDQEKHTNMLISLTEAVNNAIIHGNKQDRSKMVSIKLAQTRSGLAVRVSDQGCGFNYDQLPDPTSPERLCECGGRGVFLMNQLCDKIRYINGGSTVEMQFKIK